MIAPEVISTGQLVSGRYRLVRRIARGGMAEVWEGADQVLERTVAVKLLLPQLAADESFITRFRREAIAAARLSHPNVVATYDTGVDDAIGGGLAFIVMELVEGQSLRDHLKEGNALAPHDAIAIGAQVADALHYAHEAGIVHRDVKPANILLCAEARVKVADFGIAKAAHADAPADDDLTATGMIVGTAKYLSPEQFEGQPADRRSDVYSLGVVLYETLCGRPPFEGASDMAVGIQHVEHQPLSPRQVRAGIPRALDAVVMKAIAKAPGDRYPSAAALQSALLSVDLRVDDAVPMIVSDDTPPRGAPQTFAQSERTWLVPTVLIVIVAVVLGILGVILARSDAGQRLLDRAGSTLGRGADASAVEVRSVTSFDPRPDGDGEEHESEVANLIDGDPSTTWSTERYDGPGFAGLKEGVGFVLLLGSQGVLGELDLEGTSQGFDVEVAVANSDRGSRAAWGNAVATATSVGSSETIDLRGSEGGAVLVWITDPPASIVSIGEVRISSA